MSESVCKGKAAKKAREREREMGKFLSVGREFFLLEQDVCTAQLSRDILLPIPLPGRDRERHHSNENKPKSENEVFTTNH